MKSCLFFFYLYISVHIPKTPTWSNESNHTENQQQVIARRVHKEHDQSFESQQDQPHQTYDQSLPDQKDDRSEQSNMDGQQNNGLLDMFFNNAKGVDIGRVFNTLLSVIGRMSQFQQRQPESHNVEAFQNQHESRPSEHHQLHSGYENGSSDHQLQTIQSSSDQPQTIQHSSDQPVNPVMPPTVSSAPSHDSDDDESSSDNDSSESDTEINIQNVVEVNNISHSNNNKIQKSLSKSDKRAKKQRFKN